MDALIEDKKSLLQRFILWREKRIKEKHFILILSFLVGIFTALAAWFLKFLVEWIKEFLTENFDSTGVNWLYLVYPVVGIFLTGLFIRHIVKDDISHGVTKILYAISRRQSRIKRHNTWSSVIASAITIGFGGSVGAEAPIVLTGSAIGSNLGSAFKMEHKTLMLWWDVVQREQWQVFQSSYCRIGIYFGSFDDRPDDGFSFAIAGVVCDGCYGFLYSHRFGGYVQISHG